MSVLFSLTYIKLCLFYGLNHVESMGQSMETFSNHHFRIFMGMVVCLAVV